MLYNVQTNVVLSSAIARARYVSVNAQRLHHVRVLETLLLGRIGTNSGARAM